MHQISKKTNQVYLLGHKINTQTNKMVKLIIITILVFSLFSQSNVFCANLNDKVFFHFGRYLDDDIIIQEKHLPRNLKLRAAEYRKRYLSFKSKRQSRKSKLQSGAPSNKEDDAFMKMI